MNNPNDIPITSSAQDYNDISEEMIQGKDARIKESLLDLYHYFDIDLITLGLAPSLGAPLKWVYDCGATSERLHRIALSPGHGIGGIVLKSGRPMLFTDLDAQMDQKEYSSFPIVFAENLYSFCALPLCTKECVVGVLLIGHRTPGASRSQQYFEIIQHLNGHFVGFSVISDNFSTLEQIRNADAEDSLDVPEDATLLMHTITAHEEERRRLSRDLHDGAVQELLAISMKIEALKATINSSTRKSVDEIVENLNHVMDELRNVSVDLRPSTLDDLGLRPALQSQGKLYEKRYGPKVIIEGTLENSRTDKQIETQIYRIVQEAILNSCKYSGADYVMVTLDLEDACLEATVFDDGVGFDVAHPFIQGTGCGLEGMKERAKLIDASLELESEPGHTAIRLKAPFNEI